MRKPMLLMVALLAAGSANAQSTSSSTPDAPNDSHGTMDGPDIFRQLDTNRDGRISVQEFRKILPLLPPDKDAASGSSPGSPAALRAENLDKTFKVWDRNKDNYLSRKEFAAGLAGVSSR